MSRFDDDPTAEATDADLQEQEREVAAENPDDLQRLPDEADEGDAVEQHQVLPPADDEYPEGTAGSGT